MNNKKAFVFTIIVISILLLFAATYSAYSVTKNRESINKRIDTLNSFVFSTEQDLPRELYISGFRIIFIVERKIVDNFNYIPDFDAAFREAFYNGTFEGTFEPIMSGATFQGMIQSVNSKAAKINANVSLIIYNLTVDQEDPWNVRVNITGNLIIKDNSGLALWNKTTEIITKIPIENFEDPVYYISTFGKVTNKIKRTIYSNLSNITNLENHVENSYYINHSGSPSFLDRLEGNLGASDPNGIESLVYLPNLFAQGITTLDKSCVDYIYFSDDDPASSNINEVEWSWFKLDNPHILVYGVSAA
jgi:hypothetical protein